MYKALTYNRILSHPKPLKKIFDKQLLLTCWVTTVISQYKQTISKNKKKNKHVDIHLKMRQCKTEIYFWFISIFFLFQNNFLFLFFYIFTTHGPTCYSLQANEGRGRADCVQRSTVAPFSSEKFFLKTSHRIFRHIHEALNIN